jgi:asparagine synthase (glutamine-hydrolysing)
MFALALWDGRTRTLLAARDRAGEKPLYWTADAARPAAGLRGEGAARAPRGVARARPEALDQFLTYEYIIAPRTILKGVHKLPPGHYLTYRDGEVDVRRYWDAAASPSARGPKTRRPRRCASARARRGSQMMADVPLGAFLSGGIDSSAIVAFMSEAPRSPVNSFSMGFDDGSYNELPYAREVAERVRHQPPRADGDAGLAAVRQARRAPRRAVRRRVAVSDLPGVALAREHVTVALSGDGGDELFGGYDAYEAQALAARLRGGGPRRPAGAGRAAAAVVPPTEKKKGLVNKVKRFTLGATRAARLGHYRWMTLPERRGEAAALQPALREEALPRRRLRAGARGASRGIWRTTTAEPAALRRPVASTSPTTSW